MEYGIDGFLDALIHVDENLAERPVDTNRNCSIEGCERYYDLIVKYNCHITGLLVKKLMATKEKGWR